MIPRIKDVFEWIVAHEHTECGQALARFPLTDRLREAQESAYGDIEDRGWLSEAVADELKLAAWLEIHPESPTP